MPCPTTRLRGRSPLCARLLQIFTTINRFINGLFNLSFLTEVGELDCWLGSNYCFRILCICMTMLSFQMALPFFYLSSLKVHHLVPKGLKWPCDFPKGWKGASLKEKALVTKKRLDKLLDRSIHVNMLLMMVAHPPVSKFLLSCLECSQYNDISVLKADKRFGCGESSMCNGVAGAFLIFYTAGIPTLLAFSLRAYLSPKAKKKYKGTPTLARAKARFGFTCGKYEA